MQSHMTASPKSWLNLILPCWRMRYIDVICVPGTLALQLDPALGHMEGRNCVCLSFNLTFFQTGASLRPHIWCCGYILCTIKYQDCEFRFEIGNWQLDICAGTEGFSIKSGWHSPDTGYSCNLERHVWLSHILLCWCWFQANHEPGTTMACTVYISRYTLANSFQLLINFK